MTGALRIVPLCHLLALTGLLWTAPAGADPARISGAPVVYVRTGPGPEHRPVSVLSEGDEIETLGEAGPWTRIRTQSGEEGFVFGTFVAQAADPAATSPAPPAEAPNLADVTSTPAATPTSAGLVQDVAELRAEIEALKARISKQIDRQRAEAALPTPKTTRTPDAPRSRMLDPDVRTAIVGVLSLGLGWVLGTTFTRWRFRGQRNRLRF